MKPYMYFLIIQKDERGATAIMVGLLMVMLIGFGAVAVDLGHVYVVKNELQNAADAGALAGALDLFDSDGNVNTNANQSAFDATIANRSENVPVELDLGSGNDGDVQRGSWDLDTHEFTRSDSDDPAVINAVKVITHKSAASTFFARIFDHDSVSVNADAVAYIGYSSGLNVDFNQPLAICQDKILDEEGNYVCTKARMIHSGNTNPETRETGRWTNFSEGCAEPADTPSVTGVTCTITNITSPDISTNNGEMTPALVDVYQCWENATNKTETWYHKLPVIKCDESITCSTIVGSVGVKVLWMTDNGNDPHYNNIPQEMSELNHDTGETLKYWSQSTNCASINLGTAEGRKECWDDFTKTFNIIYIDENGIEQFAEYVPVTIYFKPDCDYDEEGGPGGDDFHVKAEYPKLVE